MTEASSLAQISIFHLLTADELAALRALAVRRHVDSGDTLFFEGDSSDALFVIESGHVKAFNTTPDGKERIQALLGPGDVVGEIGLLDGKPRSATVEALSPLELQVIHREPFHAHAVRHPELLWKVQMVLCEKLRRASQDALDASYLGVPQRLLNALAFLVRRHGQKSEAGWKLSLRLRHREIANLVGTNRETVTRLLKKFEQRGLLRVTDQHVEVPDLRALTDAADSLSE